MPATLMITSATLTSASTAKVSLTRSGVLLGSCRAARQMPPVGDG
jgi:hypothetical protein